MFGDMFEKAEEDAGRGPSASSAPHRVAFEGCDLPRNPRGPTRLAGLENQGATCYLNSLIQVLLVAPELRRAVLSIKAEQIGLVPAVSGDDAETIDIDFDSDDTSDYLRKLHCLRRIPFELQCLLGRLLLSNREALSTRELTRSFGWDRMEHADQHDVQELNRLLFSALEDSLHQIKGAPYQNISRQVKGTFRTSIRCSECEYTSSRSEEFLDLCVTTVGYSNLDDSLANLFGSEWLQGDNKYRCDGCHNLVDAEKTSRLTVLPPILTLSLMRFDFDFARMTRVKHEGRFAFPYDDYLDVGRHVLDNVDAALYELFAVVIHGGSAMGGHYHVYVRDLEHRGKWFDSAESSRSSATFSPSPSVLVQLLMDAPQRRMALSQLSVKFKSVTGQSWATACKSRWGSISQYVNSNAQLFDCQESGDGLLVQLKHDTVAIEAALDNDDESAALESKATTRTEGSSRTDRKEDDTRGRWFDINDRRVTPIRSFDIERQFSGRECAYMLFYRQCRLNDSVFPLSRADIREEMPDWLYRAVVKENKLLNELRREQEEKLNRVSYALYHESQFKLRSDRLIWDPIDDNVQPHATVDINCNRTVDDLLEGIDNKMSNLMPEIGAIVCLEKTDCGYYALCRLPDPDIVRGDSTVLSGPFMRHCRNANPFVFVCFSGNNISTFLSGPANRPIKLSLHFRGSEMLEQTLPSSMCLIDCIRHALGSLSHTLSTDIESAIESATCFVKRESTSSSQQSQRSVVAESDLRISIGQLGCRSGDRFYVSASKADSFTPEAASQLIDVTMILDEKTGDKATKTLRLRPGHKAYQVKQAMFDKVKKDSAAFDIAQWCVQVFNEDLNCWCPEYDSTIVSTIPAPKLRLVNEPPLATEPLEAFIKVSVDQTSGMPTRHVGLITKLADDVSKFRKLAASKLGLSNPNQYHLCFVNPSTGDVGSEIRENRSLEAAGLKNAIELCLVLGRPLLTGQTRLRLVEHLPYDASDWLQRLSQSPDSLFRECDLDLVVNPDFRVEDLNEILIKEGHLGPNETAAMFRRKDKNKQLLALQASKQLSSCHLGQKGVALCFNRHCDLPPQISTKNGRGKSFVDPMLLWLTTRANLPNADYDSPKPLWWPDVQDQGDDSAASLYAAVAHAASIRSKNERFLLLAKRCHDRCEWTIIPRLKDVLYSRGTGGENQGSPLTNLTNSPYSLRDGDVIAWAIVGESLGSVDAKYFIGPQDLLAQNERRLARDRRRGRTVDEDDFGDVGGACGSADRLRPLEKSLIISVPSYKPID